ncbi:MAG: cell division protein FtsA [Proteobacteria bacterium]|nr:cell division protein FtsA [Pseudomonadota bacterium]
MSLDRRLRIASAYMRTRLEARRLTDRKALAAHQQRLWRRLAPTLARTPALASLAGRPLADFPVVEPAEARADFAAWNSLGLDEASARAAAEAAERGEAPAQGRGFDAGFSTGSSGGERGLFVTTAHERDEYLGASLGKLIPPMRLLRPLRVALILRAGGSLYSDVTGAGVRFLHLGLDESAETQLQILKAFDPTHLVAPPHVLASLARELERRVSWRPALDRLFYGAEPIGRREAVWLAQAFGRAPQPIYQATEGFLGAPCAHGTLHLNEDSLIIEQEPFEGSDRWRPVITDLRRTSQPMVRVRLDDLLQTRREPCPCGSAHLAVEPVEGRVGDVWRFPGVLVFPREVDDALEAALGPSERWTAWGSPQGVTLSAATLSLRDLGATALRGLLQTRGVVIPIRTAPEPDPPFGPKRRRVRWAP